MGSVKVSIGKGALASTLATNDGIAGFMMTGVAEGSIVLGTPFLVNSMTDVTTAGMTVTNNAFAYNQLQQLYNELNAFGISSAPVYVLLVANTMKINQMADRTNANGCLQLMTASGNTLSMIALLGNDTLIYPGGTGLVTTAGINADVYTAITNAQALVNQCQTAQTPIRMILGGTSFTGTASALTDQTTSANNGVMVLIGDTASGNSAAVGLLLGREIANPVQRKPGRVKDGAISSATAFIGSTTASQYTSTSTITAKGFITFQIYPNKSGFYFTEDLTCTATTDDYKYFALGRIVDKAQKVAYAYFVNEVDDEVPNTGGIIDAGFATTLQQGITNTLNANMTSVGNITAASAFISTTQNVSSTGKVAVVLKVTPPGYATEIDILLGF